ncbi:zinc finger protein draculin-like [Toxorhynchites rutilus septentrionalis]|uniref:zinc finger protein draculin-like n=1 Tax=Toxorhynchites rutilus septentrionalis TaxID=329112 RepID=UPI002478C957|nr:zinc finger protein draculin-like [Toxorhynchites rutilus septentrionalis]
MEHKSSDSERDRIYLQYAELVKEFIAEPEGKDTEILFDICAECVPRLRNYSISKKQRPLVLRFAVSLIIAKHNRDIRPLVDLVIDDAEPLQKCLKTLIEKIVTLERLFEEGKDHSTNLDDTRNDSEHEETSKLEDISEVNSNLETPEASSYRRKKDSKYIFKNGVKYKPCILVGCNVDYEVGNRTAYLEHEKVFHRYACKLCGRVLASRTSFRNHILLHDGEKAKVKCEFCDRTFTTKGSMMVHVRDVHDNSGVHFDCQYCGSGFTEQKELFAHLHEHTECKFCDEKFHDLPNWINHNRRKHANMLYTCDQCDHISLSLKLLDRHKRMKHYKDKPDRTEHRFTMYSINDAFFHQCPQCTSQFTTADFLHQHNEEVHNHPQSGKQKQLTVTRRSREEREKFTLRYSCDVCGKMYRFKNSLWSHKHKEHNMPKQMSICDVCGLNFKHQSYLKAHIAKKHATELPFQCKSCPKAYSQAFLLKEHAKSHCAEKTYGCPHCHYRAKQSHALKDHVRRLHTSDRPFKCSKCDKGFINRNDLRKHMPTHNKTMPFQCEHCEQIFRRRMDVKRHFARVHVVSRNIKKDTRARTDEDSDLDKNMKLQDDETEIMPEATEFLPMKSNATISKT